MLAEQAAVGSEVQGGVVDGCAVRFPLIDADNEVDARLAAASSRSVTGPGTVTAWSTSIAYQPPSPSQIGWASIQTGLPGMNTSGNTTMREPPAAAFASSSTALVRVAS